MEQHRLLVVEDQAIIALDLASRLANLGYEVVGTANNADGAVRQALLHKPDLILMDIHLQGERDGIQAVEQLRTLADLPVIYLTAHSDLPTLQRARLTEPYGYILKPFEDRELHMAIEIGLYKHAMERKLKENERWLAATLKSMADAVIATTGQQQILLMNPIAETLTGWTLAEARGQPLSTVVQLVDEATRTPLRDPVIRIGEDGVLAQEIRQTHLVTRDGTERPIEGSAAPIRDERGNITGAVLILRDITERQQAEASLRWAEQRYRKLFEEAPLMYICTRNQAGKPIVTECNRVFLSTLEYSLAEVLGRPLSDFYALESRIELQERGGYQRALERGVVDEERIFLTRTGRRVHTMLTAVSETNVRGEIVGTRAMYVDITQRRQADEALRASHAELTRLLAQAKELTAAAQKATQLKDEILANTSHELRSPLTIIIGALDLMLNEDFDMVEAERHTFLTAAHEASDKLLGLVNDLLDLAKLEAGGVALQREAVDISALLTEVQALMRGQAEPKGLDLDLQLPAAPLPTCFTDYGYLRRVLLHILSNAIKFTETGSVTISARLIEQPLDRGRADRQLEIMVRDTGIGVAPEVQRQVFQPFVQGQRSTTRRYGGAGLGLSLSQRLVEVLDGSLTLTSAGEGSGTTVTLVIPSPDADQKT